MRVPAMALALLAMAVSSCGPRVDTSACPKPKPYTKAEQTQAASELLTLCPAAKPDAAKIHLKCPRLILPRFIDDYKAERDQLRACN